MDSFCLKFKPMEIHVGGPSCLAYFENIHIKGFLGVSWS